MSSAPIMRPGFYWARRRDSGELTIVEAYDISDDASPCLSFNLMGNLHCPNLDELNEHFELLARAVIELENTD